MNGRLSCLFIQDGAAFIQDERGTVLISLNFVYPAYCKMQGNVL